MPLTRHESINDSVSRVLFGTVDPGASDHGRPLPALTTVLYRVCDNDGKKFAEAARVIELFIAEALKNT